MPLSFDKIHMHFNVFFQPTPETKNFQIAIAIDETPTHIDKSGSAINTNRPTGSGKDGP